MTFDDDDDRRRLLADMRAEHDPHRVMDLIFAYLEVIGEGVDEGRREIFRFNDRVRVILRWLVAIVLALALVATVSFWRQADLNAQTKALGERNRTAIRVGCTLLSNAIIQSGATGNMQSPQGRLTAHYIAVIHRMSTPAERRTERHLLKLASKAGPVIRPPDCERITLHPGSVKALPLEVTP
jgi:hypothetical protein